MYTEFLIKLFETDSSFLIAFHLKRWHHIMLWQQSSADTFFSLVNKIIFHKRRMTVFMTNFKKNLWDWVTWMVQKFQLLPKRVSSKPPVSLNVITSSFLMYSPGLKFTFTFLSTQNGFALLIRVFEACTKHMSTGELKAQKSYFPCHACLLPQLLKQGMTYNDLQ